MDYGGAQPYLGRGEHGAVTALACATQKCVFLQHMLMWNWLAFGISRGPTFSSFLRSKDSIFQSASSSGSFHLDQVFLGQTSILGL